MLCQDKLLRLNIFYFEKKKKSYCQVQGKLFLTEAAVPDDIIAGRGHLFGGAICLACSLFHLSRSLPRRPISRKSWPRLLSKSSFWQLQERKEMWLENRQFGMSRFRTPDMICHTPPALVEFKRELKGALWTWFSFLRFFLLSTYYVATVAVVINNNDHHPVTVQILLHVLVKTAGCTRVLKFSQLFGKGVGQARKWTIFNKMY